MKRRYVSPWISGLILGVVAAGTTDSRALAAQETPATTVGVSVTLVDLVEIDGSEQTFFADVVINASWRDPALASPDGRNRVLPLDEADGPNLIVVNQRGLDNSLPDVVRVDGEGNARYSLRLTGDFSARLNLREFPRDTQTFGVWVVAAPLSNRAFDIEPNLGEGVLIGDTLSISDWTLEDSELTSRDYQAGPASPVLPGVSASFTARRDVGYYIIQVLLPLTAVALMAWTVFWIDPSIVTTRVSVVVTTMLTLIAYRFMLGNLVPRLSYLTRLDYFMLTVTGLVLFTLFLMAGGSYLRSRGREETVKRIDSVGRIAIPVILATVTWILWM